MARPGTHSSMAGDHRPIDRAAMIEAASRSLRQQMGRTRDRPRSKGSLTSSADMYGGHGHGEHSAETSQRRNRSAENQHRRMSAPRDGPRPSRHTGSASALDNYHTPDDSGHPLIAPTAGGSQEDAASGGGGGSGSAPGGLAELLGAGSPEELRRPQSRKKGPSASAAAGLGAFSGPARLHDAFEQRKTRQPIPVESWGPRPPSRHGPPPKVGHLDGSLEEDQLISPTARSSVGSGASSSMGRPNSRAGVDQGAATWACARGLPARGLGESAGRRGERRTPNQRVGAPEDLGIFGRAARSPSQKSFSGVFLESGVEGTQRPLYMTGDWDDAAGLDGHPLGGSGGDLADGVPERASLGHAAALAPWAARASPTGSPSRLGRNAAREASTPVSLEDVEADSEAWGDRAAPPQVIITRSSQATRGRGELRRQLPPQQAAQQPAQQVQGRDIPFTTTLDVDFLNLFAN